MERMYEGWQKPLGDVVTFPYVALGPARHDRHVEIEVDGFEGAGSMSLGGASATRVGPRWWRVYIPTGTNVTVTLTKETASPAPRVCIRVYV